MAMNGRARLALAALGLMLGTAVPAMAQPRHDQGHHNGHRGQDRRYMPQPNYSAPFFGFGLFGPPVAMRPHYAPPPPVYYPPPPRGYYQAPPPAYYGY